LARSHFSALLVCRAKPVAIGWRALKIEECMVKLRVKGLFVFILFFIGTSLIHAEIAEDQARLANIPKVSRPPKLEDFLQNKPREAEWKTTDFRQIAPLDCRLQFGPAEFLAYIHGENEKAGIRFLADLPVKSGNGPVSWLH
jgi:hypothetical protein